MWEKGRTYVKKVEMTNDDVHMMCVMIQPTKNCVSAHMAGVDLDMAATWLVKLIKMKTLMYGWTQADRQKVKWEK